MSSDQLRAQSADLAFSGMAIDPESPVELSADQLTVSQTDGTAIFTGNVLAIQGDLRLSAGAMRIEYQQGEAGERGRIARLMATDGVTLVTQAEAAEAREAIYSIEDGTVELIGDVLLTQGPNTISGDRLKIDLATGTGSVEGRVRTVLQGGGNN
jgi:lipopolysaccharide export system protein LptA